MSFGFALVAIFACTLSFQSLKASIRCSPVSGTELTNDLRKRASELGARLFRQNSGMGWIGKAERIFSPRTIRVGPGDVVIRNARPFHAGFDGLSDLGGWTPITITADMVGATFAQYAQVEVKFGRDRATKEQIEWIEAVNKAGGRAGIARNENDLSEILFGKR